MTALLCLTFFMLGGILGVLVMCLCFIAKDADEKLNITERPTGADHQGGLP